VSVIQLLLQNSILEKFVPSRYRPLDETIIQGEETNQLIQRAEKLLDDLIEQPASTMRFKKTFTNHSPEFQVTLKINKKRIWLLLADTSRSPTTYKKRIVIECYRKYIKSKDGRGKCTMSYIWYRNGGQTTLRNIKTSRLFQSLFYKIDLLDDILLTQLIGAQRKQSSLDSLSPQVGSNAKNQEEILIEIQRFIQYKKHVDTDQLIDTRVESLINQLKEVVVDYALLEVEERHIIKRIIRQDLPNLLQSYTSLSVQDQIIHKESVFIALSKMEVKVKDLLKQIRTTKNRRMEYLIKLNQKRYP